MSRFLLLIVFCTASLNVFGQTPATQTTGQAPPTTAPPHSQGHRMKALKKMDANADGKIARDEWRGQAEGFDQLDADKDGFLTRAEFGQRVKDRGAHALKHFDANADGKIARDEWTRNAKAFDKLDTNADGFVTPDEMRNRKGHHNKQS